MTIWNWPQPPCDVSLAGYKITQRKNVTKTVTLENYLALAVPLYTSGTVIQMAKQYTRGTILVLFFLGVTTCLHESFDPKMDLSNRIICDKICHQHARDGDYSYKEVEFDWPA